MIQDPWFYVLATAAVLIVGISKSGFGGGLGVVGVPLMALTVAPFRAAAILLPILCVMDLFGMWAYRRDWDRPNLAIMLPGATLGIVVATFTYQYFSEDALRLLIGGIAIAFTLDHWLRRGMQSGPTPEPNVIRGGFWSAVAGFTSFAAHSGGPPVSMYLLPQRLAPRLFVGTTVVFFLFVNYLKLIPYAFLDQLRTDNLLTALVLLPLAPLGIWLGLVLRRRVSPTWFYRICYVLLFLTGLKLAWDGVTGILGGL